MKRAPVERLGRGDERAVAELGQAFETVRLHRGDPLPSLLGEFARLVRAEFPLAYGVALSTDMPSVSWLHSPRPAEFISSGRSLLDRSLRRSGGFGLYSALQVARAQRDRAVVLRDLTPDPRAMLRAWSFDHLGLAEHDQVRVLLTERGALLGWVGAFRPDDEPFSGREKTILQRLTTSIGRRFRLAAQLRSAPLEGAALGAALEALGMAAVVTDASGRVAHANALGLTLRADDRIDFAASVRAALAGDTSRWRVRPLVAPGLPRHSLLLAAPPASADGANVGEAATQWGLTAREREVLHLVVRGLSNRAIAVELACSERTVEAHVAKVLEKSDCETRAEVVATVWKRARSGPQRT